MMLPDSIDVYATKLAGFAGAFISLKFIQGSWPERIIMALGGSLISYYGSPWASSRTGLPEGLCGFLLGLFGMAICAKVWELIQQAPVASFWQPVLDWWKRKFG